MSVEPWPGSTNPDSENEALLDWFELNLRDKELLRDLQRQLIEQNPALYRILADTAADIAPGDPKGHETYFGALLLRAAESEFRYVPLEAPPQAA